MIACFRNPRFGLLLVLGAALASTPRLPAASIGSQLSTTEKQQLQQEARIVVDLIQNHHYSGRAFREIENAEMIARFLDELDPAADFLTTADVEFLHRRFDRTLKSVYLLRGDLQPAFEMFDRFAERARERLAWIAARLTRDFDLTVDDSYPLPRGDKPERTTSGAPADQRWERQLKHALLVEIFAGRSLYDAKETVAKRYREVGRSIATTDAFVVRERFFDSVIRSFDPHSGYFSADSTREFEVDMENAVVGLGLDLRKDQGRCVVAGVQPGSPADLHSGIGPGDTLVAIAEGAGAWVPIDTLRLREIVTLLRGEPGRPVRLAYLPEGSADRTEVSLERTRVVIPAGRARGGVSDVPDTAGQRRPVGWIALPSFYAGGSGDDATSAAKDMRELLEQMRALKIEGLVLDLRSNPGGLLTEAVAISQLFLPRGVVMLSRGMSTKVTEHLLKDEPPVYTGPLVVLVSAQSASASEILAGMLKFHRRAVVVGGEATYGKGTSQAYIPLAKLPGIDAKNARNWGTLRLTSERFSLPDGKSIQQAGVRSQLVFPDFDPAGFERESALPHALSEESLSPPAAPASIAEGAMKATDELLRNLTDTAESHFKELPEWKLWRQEQQYRAALYARKTISLQLEARQKDWDEVMREYQAAQRTRRELTASAAYPIRPLEIADVQTAFSAHETRWRELNRTAAVPVLNHLRRGGFFFENDQGRIRELRVSSIDPMTFFGDLDALAAAFTEATGRATTSAEARQIIQALARVETETDGELIAAAGRAIEGPLPEPTLRRGIEAVLLRMVLIEPALRQTRAALDIPLRESQRLAATWAARLATVPAP